MMGTLSKKILIAVLALLFTGAILGCDLTSTTTDTTTTEVTTTAAIESSSSGSTTTATRDIGIVLSGSWQTVYDYGRPFDPTGMVVTLVRSDGTEQEVAEYTILGYNGNVSGFKTVRVRYNGLEASFTAYVKEPVVATDVALELDLPDRLVYSIGESCDWTGLAVRVVQSDGDRIELAESSYEVSSFSSTEAGLFFITVTYSSLTATFPYFVQEPASAGGVTLSVTPPTKTAYVEGEILDLAGLVVSLRVTGETTVVLTSGQYVVSSPNMNETGTHTVIVAALGMEYSFTITVEASTSTLDLIAYFDDAEGLTGEALVLALREILTTTVQLKSYGDSRYILDETDADPNRSGYLIEFYTGASRNAAWDNGITWNREHLWPQSMLGIDVDNSYIGVGSDLFNLAPADPGLNSSRGNKWFSTITNASCYNLSRTSIRGDVARGYLYMTIMYDYLELVELETTQDPAVYHFGDLSTLLQWCKDDPVDAFERHRNEVIYSYQHNRNPFVDHPELIDLIWGNA